MTFSDPRDITGNGEGQPANKGFAIVPSDTADLVFNTRAIYIGGSGNLTVRLYEGDIIVLVGVVVGTIIPIRTNKVYSTGTTATNLVALL